jgi:hypothetical protein
MEQIWGGLSSSVQRISPMQNKHYANSAYRPLDCNPGMRVISCQRVKTPANKSIRRTESDTMSAPVVFHTHAHIKLDSRGQRCVIDVPPHHTAEGCKALCERLETFWHDRGHATARFWPERAKYENGNLMFLPSGEPFWIVRSNLINGLPPKSETPSLRLAFSKSLPTT